MGANFSYDDVTTTCTHSNRDSVAYEPSSRYSPMSASTPSLRPPSAPPRAGSAPSSRFTPSLTRYKSSVLDSTHCKENNTSRLENSPNNKVESSSHSRQSSFIIRKSTAAEKYTTAAEKCSTSAVPAAAPAAVTAAAPALNTPPVADYLTATTARAAPAPPAAASNSTTYWSATDNAAAVAGNHCCNCRKDVDNLQREMQLLKSEVNTSRETIKVLREREVKLRERLSEQARRQFEKGTTMFEDINLGGNRPTQLVRRYGNLYTETRLEALDALDELIEVAQFKNLKGKLLLSVIVLAFRNARKNYEETKVKVKQLLHIPDVTRASNNFKFQRDHVTNFNQSGILKKDDTEAMIKEIDDIISMFLRKTVDKHNLRQNYEEVCDRVWATLYDFPSLRHCDGLLKYIDESVRLAWALSIQNPPLVIDYDLKRFDPDLHSRFHTSDPNSDVIKCVLWPMLREGDEGPCLYKGVIIT